MRTVRRLLVVIAVAASLCAVVWVPALAGPLRPPTGLSGRADSDTQVSLSWNAAGGATGYQVLRGAHSGGPYALVKTTTALSYSDGGLVPATTYYYVLRSTSGSRTSQPSAQVAVTTLFTPPANARASADLDRVDLTWDAVAGVLRYEIVRSASDGTNLAVVGSTTQTSYTDTTVAPATGYAYWIRGVWTGSTSDSSPLTVFTGRRTTTTLSASPTPSEDQQCRPHDARPQRRPARGVPRRHLRPARVEHLRPGAPHRRAGREPAGLLRAVPGLPLRAGLLAGRRGGRRCHRRRKS